MQEHPQPEEALPEGCFTLDEVQHLRHIQGQVLTGVNYYLWKTTDGRNLGFLYFLELIFAENEPLYLTSGEDSAGIQVSDADTLVHTARQLQDMHGQACIHRMSAASSTIWADFINRPLQAIHLLRHDSGLYANEALQLDLGNRQVVVALDEQDGLAIIAS